MLEFEKIPDYLVGLTSSAVGYANDDPLQIRFEIFLLLLVTCSFLTLQIRDDLSPL
jgi:hypothetical protein